jgi:hypothetical protein
MKTAEMVRAIKTLKTERELKLILKATRAKLFDVRFVDEPEEKAAILRTRAAMKTR